MNPTKIALRGDGCWEPNKGWSANEADILECSKSTVQARNEDGKAKLQAARLQCMGSGLQGIGLTPAAPLDGIKSAIPGGFLMGIRCSLLLTVALGCAFGRGNRAGETGSGNGVNLTC